MIEITRKIYRDALHIYLIHAYPDDDLEYYSKWAWMVSSTNDFFKQRNPTNYSPKPAKGFPIEIRFGCHCSGNTKLRCYASGFIFDTNHIGDSDDIIKEVKRIKKVVEDAWAEVGIPVYGRKSALSPEEKIEKMANVLNASGFQIIDNNEEFSILPDTAKEICPLCNGTGSEDNPIYTCPECCGTGTIKNNNI